MATGLGVETNDVEVSYPALFQRMKGSREIPSLVQIDGPVDAIGYARAFEEHGRKEFAIQAGRSPSEDVLFSDKEIQDFYFQVAGHNRSVSQGDFFDRLHVEAERKLTTAPPRRR